MDFVQYGIYKIKDSYFHDFPNDKHMDNKFEMRPYYLAVKKRNGIIWMLPMSTQVEKYKELIAKDTEQFGKCIRYHIIRFMGKDSAVLIGNMIPVTAKYIKEEFTIRGSHYIIQKPQDTKAIKTKVASYLALVKEKKLKPYVDILSIERKLLSRMKNVAYLMK